MAGSIPASPTASGAGTPATALPRRDAPGPGPSGPGPRSVRRAADASPWAEAWRRFRRHRMALLSLAVLTLMVAAVAFGPLVWGHSIDAIDFTARLAGPSLAHPLGTDDLGRTCWPACSTGGRIPLAVGLAAMLMAIVVGVLIGAIAGISRGAVDAALMWLTDLFLSLPQLPLLLVNIYLFRDSLKGAFGVEVGTFILIVAVIGGFRWMPVARLVRAQFFSLREKEFVEAARALGATTSRQVVNPWSPHKHTPG